MNRRQPRKRRSDAVAIALVTSQLLALGGDEFGLGFCDELRIPEFAF
jgi:hypothetical protein